jgi:Uma2 family endonuclease
MGNAVKAITKYSYADYLTWGEDERWEIIDGIPFNMSPAPKLLHQRVQFNVSIIVGNFLKGKKCQAFNPPFDVRFSNKNEQDVLIENVVQPDLVIFCDEKKLDDKGGIGAPDFIIEILSPSTAEKDFGEKTLLYQKYGVKEYWIIDPDKNIVYVTMLNKDKRFEPWLKFDAKAKIKCTVLKGLIIDMKEVFS